MDKHPQDAAGNRDLVNEANEIKQALVNEPPQKEVTKPKPINFTSLAQSAIPNFSASKILLNRINVRYVPDFYYILDRLQHQFILAKHDKMIKRNENLNLYSFTLYVTYSLMYAFLDIVNEVNPEDSNIQDVLTFLRGFGFNNNHLPNLANTWITALGKYTDPQTKRTFIPYFPRIVTEGNYFDNYFVSNDTGHLLPNFRGMFSIIGLFSDPNAINIPPNNRTFQVRLGADFPGVPQLVGTLHSRRNVYRIPGLERLAVKIADDQLPELLNVALLREDFPTPLHRYMMLDANVLTYLKQSVPDYFNYIDSFAYTNIAPNGDSMTMIPLISDPTREVIIRRSSVNATAANGNVPAIPTSVVSSKWNFACRVKSRFEIINGNVDYVYQTPIVRIIDNEESVSIDGYVHVDPQDPWYRIEHEFQTPVVTINEAQAFFRKT